MIGGMIATAGMLLFGGACLMGEQHEPEELPSPQEIDYAAMSKQIRRLHMTMERLEMLERMLTDIALCDPEVIQKSFQCSWQSGGENRDYSFWTSGEDRNAAHLREMALDERDRLRTSLLEQIDRIYEERRQKNGRKRRSPEPELTEVRHGQ